MYNAATTPRENLFFSKLAILELCGWIETSMDSMVRRCAKKTLKRQANRDAADKIIKRTYSFEYDEHFRRMLIHVIGLKGIETIEQSLNPALFQKMKAALHSLKISRDNAAHTYIKGTTVTLDAPSLTRLRFTDVHDGLANIDHTLKKFGL